VRHSHYPIPWSALKYDTALAGYRTGIAEEHISDAPEFSDDSWEDRDRPELTSTREFSLTGGATAEKRHSSGRIGRHSRELGP
jgi:hypothetical protein